MAKATRTPVILAWIRIIGRAVAAIAHSRGDEAHDDILHHGTAERVALYGHTVGYVSGEGHLLYIIPNIGSSEIGR